MLDCFGIHWVHVVYDDLVVDLVTFTTQIQTFVPCNNMLSNLSPLSRDIELLVDVSIEPEGRRADDTTKLKICEPLFERVETSELSMRSNNLLHVDPPHALRNYASR